METEAPSQETDAGGGPSTAEIGLIIGLTLSFITLLCGGGVIWRFWNCIEERRKKRSQGGPSATGKASSELESNQDAKKSSGAGATGSQANATVLDQSPNHQGEIKSSEGDTSDPKERSNELGARDSSGAGATGSEENETKVDMSCNQGQIRQKLELVASPPPCVPPVSQSVGNLKTSINTPSLQTPPISLPKSLLSFSPTSRVEPMPLAIHVDPRPGEDVQDNDLFNISRHLNLDSYRILGLALGYTLDQLDAFTTKNCNDVPRAGLDMLRHHKGRVGHIRKAEFINLLQRADLPSLVQFS